MTATELKKAMLDFACTKESEYNGLLTHISRENKTEMKALNIQRNMFRQAATFLQYDFGGRYHEARERIVFHFQSNGLFADYYDEFCALCAEDKKLFVTFAYPMLMVMRVFYCPRSERIGKETNVEKVFENKLIVGTVGEILKEWQRLWNTHGCMKCEVFS